MKQHVWVKCVLDDMAIYAAQNELPNDLLAALAEAAEVAKVEFVETQTGLAKPQRVEGCVGRLSDTIINLE